MRNIKIEELFYGAWVNDNLKGLEPKIINGIENDRFVSVKVDCFLTENMTRPLEEVYPLQINEKLLRGFGFRKAKGDNVWLKQVADMRLTIGLRWKSGIQICRRCAISGRITCWNEEIRYLHELQRWWNDRVYFPFGVPLELEWKGIKEEIEELK